MAFSWSMKPLHRYRWAVLYLFLGGLAMVIGGLWIGRDSAQFLELAARAEGIVVGITEKRDVKDPAMDHAIVRFSSPETGLWPSPFAVSDAVQVA